MIFSMSSNVAKFGYFVIMFWQCLAQFDNKGKVSNSSLTNSNNTKLDWENVTRKEFGQFNGSSRDPLITRRGFNKLMKSLGLLKNSTRVKNYDGETVKCFSPSEILRLHNISNSEKGITKEQFQGVCPILLLQIHSRVCKPVVVPAVGEKKDTLKIWLYSCGSVVVCSLVGLIVVWLIPILPKSYYNSISQLLIALAVGSLTGDALLHLIPHALLDDGSGGHSHGKGSPNDHSQMVWKALAAFIGIHLFFLTERITILCQNLKSKRKLKNRQHSHDNVYAEIPSGDGFDDHDKIGVKFSENKSASIVKLHWASKSRKYSSSSREMEHAGSHNGLNTDAHIGAHLCNRPKNKPHVNSDCPDSMNIELCETTNPYSMAEEELNGQRSASNLDNRPPLNGDIKSSNNQLAVEAKTPEKGIKASKESNWSNRDEEKLISNQSFDVNANNAEVKVLGPKISEKEVEPGAGGATVKSSLAHPFHNKPHGHHHGHSHDLSSVKAIAYTVIAGDGLHNFCDGIAIGAAFANDLRGGLSTSIAVFCHELPHELGDFVVLLHAGMSFRTAIFYNLLSSIFCAAGMVIGVLLGAVPSVSSWIFMLTAGMFLYIALVDMMPELSTRRLQGNKNIHRPSILFLWQNMGLILGAVIMLLIALYEERMF